jgi:uncharacterized protein
MRALLDINVLIALLDGSHVHHGLVTEWLAHNLDAGWASCPITQNGCIRLLSQPAYPNAVPVAQVAQRLTDAARHPSHVFWPDTISLLQPDGVVWDRILGSRQVTDVYLLALAVRHDGRFVTLDRGIALAAVTAAESRHLVTLA